MPTYKIPAHKVKDKEWTEVLPRNQLFLNYEGTIRPDEVRQTVVRDFNSYVHRFPDGDNPFEKKTKRKKNMNTNEIRVKTAHSNEWVNLEILSAKYASLSGITVPWTFFCKGAEHDNPAMLQALEKRKDKDTLERRPNYFVASQRLKGYHDLSTFIEYVYNNQLDAFFSGEDESEKENRLRFIELYSELTELKKLPNPNTAANKTKKRDCILGCFSLMPTEIKDMIDEAFVVSSWLGNWDMFNWDLTNTGFTVLHKEDGSVVIEPAIIDFGNCLKAGFGGKHKEDSLEAANTAAKLYSEDPENKRHYDYDLSPISPIEAAMFSAIPGLALASIPRREPFEALFAHNDERVIQCIEDRRDKNGRLSKGFMRGLYRVACITDETIDKVTDEWFHLGGAINYSSSDPSKHYTKDDLSGLMKQRRDYMRNTFAPEIAEYEQLEEAKETLQEVSNAIFDLTGNKLIDTPIQSPRSPSRKGLKRNESLQSGYPLSSDSLSEDMLGHPSSTTLDASWHGTDRGLAATPQLSYAYSIRRQKVIEKHTMGKLD